MVIHNGPFGASFCQLCSLCRVLVDSLIAWGIGVVVVYYTITLYYTISTIFSNDINDLALGVQYLYYTITF